MMAAIAASKNGANVTIVEQNPYLGKKLNITGKGRCNLTNNCDTQTFMKNLTRNGKFLYSAYNVFGASEVMAFFEERGVELITERGGRVFPASGRARDITDALTSCLNENKVTVFQRRVVSLDIKDGAVRGVFTGKSHIKADAVILATGGCSYPLTGSDGSGYVLSESAGHTVIPLEASLVPLLSDDEFCGELQGVALKNVTLKLVDEAGKTTFTDGPGEMLFTHFGLSGPMVLSASAHYKHGENILIDLKPGLTNEQLNSRLLRDFSERINQTLENALRGVMLASLIPVVLKLSNVPLDKKVNELTKQERLAIIGIMKSLPVRISGKAAIEDAIITRGGIDIKEVMPKTMESRICKELYFAGEILDIDAYTGGFNLQIALSTGYTAGMYASL